MDNKVTIEKLKSELLLADANNAKRIAQEISDLSEDRAIDYFISLLDTDSPLLWGIAADKLSKAGDDKGLKAILSAIKENINGNYCANLSFTLQFFDCSNNLADLFDLMFYGSYHVKMYVGIPLKQQSFNYTAEDLMKIKRKWDECLLSPGKCRDIEEAKDEIESYLHHFAITQ